MSSASWNRCFICSSLLEEEGGKEEKKRGKYNNNLYQSHKILLMYLLSDPDFKNPLTKDIFQFTEGNKVKSELPCLAKRCSFCTKLADSVVSLQLELEVIQMKIIDQLETLRKAIVNNSRLYGGNVRVKEDLDRFEESLGEREELGGSCENERKFLSCLHYFQTAVFENDTAQLRIPIISLEKYTQGKIPSLTHGKIPARKRRGIAKKLIPPITAIKDERTDIFKMKDNDDINNSDFEMKLDNKAHLDDHDKPTVIAKKRKPGRPKKTDPKIPKKKKIRKRRPNGDPLVPKRVPSKAQLLYREIIRAARKNKSSSIREIAPGKNRIWKCDICSLETWQRPFHIEEHLRTHETPEKNHSCPDCPGVKYTHKAYLELHLTLHSFRRKCDVCNASVLPIEMKAHIEKTHSDKVFQCESCHYCFGEYKNFIQHSAQHGRGRMLKCELCPDGSSTEYSVRQELPRHLYECHGIKDLQLKCSEPGCSQVFYYSALLNRHMAVHQRKFVCTSCDKVYQSQTLLDYHNRTKHAHKVDLFQCDSCEQLFSTEDKLDRHKIADHGLPKFLCELCIPHKEFGSKPSLAYHQRVYHGMGKKMKVYKCKLCEKTSTTKLGMRKHEDSHVKSKDFFCEVCGFATNSADNLRRHSAVHTDREKKFECSYCQKRFVRKDQLVTHLRVHTQETPFQCEDCGAAFNHSRTLSNHKRIHTRGRQVTPRCGPRNKPRDVREELSSSVLEERLNESQGEGFSIVLGSL